MLSWPALPTAWDLPTSKSLQMSGPQPAPLPPLPQSALLCCSREVQGLLSQGLKVVKSKAGFPMRMTLWAIFPTARGWRVGITTAHPVQPYSRLVVGSALPHLGQ